MPIHEHLVPLLRQLREDKIFRHFRRAQFPDKPIVYHVSCVDPRHFYDMRSQLRKVSLDHGWSSDDPELERRIVSKPEFGGPLPLVNLPSDKTEYHLAESGMGFLSLARSVLGVNVCVAELHGPCKYAQGVCNLNPLDTLRLAPFVVERFRKAQGDLLIVPAFHIDWNGEQRNTYLVDTLRIVEWLNDHARDVEEYDSEATVMTKPMPVFA